MNNENFTQKFEYHLIFHYKSYIKKLCFQLQRITLLSLPHNPPNKKILIYINKQHKDKDTIKILLQKMKKNIELSFIDNTILYNLLQRGSSTSKNKNNFIIYDMSGGEIIADDEDDEFQNILSINEDVSQLLLNSKDENIKLTEISKILPKNQEELFNKNKRSFNFILIQPKDSEFVNLFNQVVLQFRQTENKTLTQQDDEEQKYQQLLVCGLIKVDYNVFNNELEKKLKENPEIEALCSDSVLNWRKAIALYKTLKYNKINELHLVRQSAWQFFTSYPFMKNYFISLNNASQQTYPNDVLFNKIYYGNWKHAQNEEIINQIGITHIVNMTCEVDNYFASNQNISYLKINIDDEDTSNISQHFKETYQFISQAIKKSTNKILIHCAQGKSRSASIVCMYLMRTFKWTFENTLKYVQDRREVANPNYGFAEQLKKFENNQNMFEGESLDELNQSQKFLNSLSDFEDKETCESPSNEQDKQNAKQNQQYHPMNEDLINNYMAPICNQ